MSVCRKSLLLLFVLTLGITYWNAAGAAPLFPQALKIDEKKLKPEAGPSQNHELAYISPSLGAFVLAGKQGHGIFRYNHNLEVDVHRHDLTFVKTDGGGDYLIYAIDSHPDEYLIFALKQVKGDEGYRIFYAHVEKNPDPKIEPKEHRHIWCLDAKQFEYHEHRAGEKVISTKKK